MNATQDEQTPPEKEKAPPNAPEGYATKAEVAARFQKKPRTIERWMKLGLIPYIKLGKGKRATVIFRWSDVTTQVEARFRIGGRI